MKKLKVIFLGTPEFAVNSLRSLVDTPWINVLSVITQPDRPANRGKKIIPPPVKTFALENSLNVLQTEKISKDSELIQKIKNLNPDVLITCAFGQILSQEVLDIALTLNVHASLLPKYRGAAPINWAIINGDNETGISIMKTVKALDAGPVLIVEKCNININETSEELFKKLSLLGGKALIAGLELIRDENFSFSEQDESKVTLAPMLKKEMGHIDWTKKSIDIHNQIRGLQPWPSTYTTYKNSILKIWKTNLSNKTSNSNQNPGSIVEVSSSIYVKTGDGVLEVLEVQPENKNRIEVKSWVNGARVQVSDCFI